MKTKSFQAYLEQRLSKEEIAEIDEQAQLEFIKNILIARQEAAEGKPRCELLGMRSLLHRHKAACTNLPSEQHQTATFDKQKHNTVRSKDPSSVFSDTLPSR